MSLLYIIFIIVPAVKITKKDTNGYFFYLPSAKLRIFFKFASELFLK